MVDKYQADRSVSDLVLLEIGEAMIRVSRPVRVHATKVKVFE